MQTLGQGHIGLRREIEKAWKSCENVNRYPGPGGERGRIPMNYRGEKEREPRVWQRCLYSSYWKQYPRAAGSVGRGDIGPCHMREEIDSIYIKKMIRRLSEIEKNVEEIGRGREKMREREVKGKKSKTGQTKAKGLH
jgi:hypothetical protein